VSFFKGEGFDHVKVNLVEHLPPSIVKDKPHTFDEGYLSRLYRFVQLVFSMAPLSGLKI